MAHPTPLRRWKPSMSRRPMRSVVGVSLLLLAACGGNTRAADVGEDGQRTPSVLAPRSAGTSAASPLARPPSTPAPSPAVKAEDLSLVRDFVAFAVQPSVETAGMLPFAGMVRLGLSRDLRTGLAGADTSPSSAWVLRAEGFRAYVGPFSALELIQRHADETGSTSIRAGAGAFQVSVGDHPHCASPSVPAPQGFERHRRVSVQPSETSIDSCVAWFTVDLFLNKEGGIAAVTLDVWEP